MGLTHRVAFAPIKRRRPADLRRPGAHTETLDKNDRSTRYIVRVLHRRDQGEQIVGIVESVENGACHAFIDRDELWAILMRATPPKPGPVEK